MAMIDSGGIMNKQKNLIKVYDQDKANQLIDLGFKYILESINGKPTYAFFVSEKLIGYLNSNFDSKDFFYNNMLHF